MSERASRHETAGAMTRRDFLRTGAAVAGGLALGMAPGRPAVAQPADRPNFLFVICDQMNLDAMSCLGNPYVRTPHLDRLAARGTLFMESHSTNPVCSPARSSLMTGRYTQETGVVTNTLPIRDGIPHIGEWLSGQGYETVYCGKWHLPHGFAPANLPGFKTFPAGPGEGMGDDCFVSRSCEAFLRNRAGEDGRPFLMVASFHQPHDICYWMISPDTLVPDRMPFPQLAADLPALPPNHTSRPRGMPEQAGWGFAGFDTDERWRYYLYCYYRMVEMLDHDVGLLLQALEETGHAQDTVIVFTSDHGEGAGRHGNVQKWHPYDESMKVPMIWSWPGVIREGAVDDERLVSGVDVVSTLCDFAGVEAPPLARGLSLRPLLEGRPAPWRDHLVSEWKGGGRIVRTPRYKYVMHADSQAVALFDMQDDPWEMENLAGEPGHADRLVHHREMLTQWEARLDVAPG